MLLPKQPNMRSFLYFEIWGLFLLPSLSVHPFCSSLISILKNFHFYLRANELPPDLTSVLSRQRRVSIKVIFLLIFLSKNCILVSKCSEDIWIVNNRPVYFTSLLKRWGSGETHMTRGYISNVFFSKLSNHFINCQSFID